MPITIRSLRTPTPEAGYRLAIELAQKGVLTTQPSERIQELLRPVYSTNADSLISVTRTIGIYYQIVAAANNYWRGRARNSNGRNNNNRNRSAMNRNNMRTAANPGTGRNNAARKRKRRNNRNRTASGNPGTRARRCRRRRVAR